MDPPRGLGLGFRGSAFGFVWLGADGVGTSRRLLLSAALWWAWLGARSRNLNGGKVVDFGSQVGLQRLEHKGGSTCSSCAKCTPYPAFCPEFFVSHMKVKKIVKLQESMLDARTLPNLLKQPCWLAEDARISKSPACQAVEEIVTTATQQDASLSKCRPESV